MYFVTFLYRLRFLVKKWQEVDRKGALIHCRSRQGGPQVPLPFLLLWHFLERLFCGCRKAQDESQETISAATLE